MPRIPTREYPLQLIRDNACKCRDTGVVIARYLLVLIGTGQRAPRRKLTAPFGGTMPTRDPEAVAKGIGITSHFHMFEYCKT